MYNSTQLAFSNKKTINSETQAEYSKSSLNEILCAINEDRPINLSFFDLTSAPTLDCLMAFAEGGFPGGQRFRIHLHEINQLSIDTESICSALSLLKTEYHIAIKSTAMLLPSTREAIALALA